MKPCSTLLANDATMVIRNECFLEIVMWESADGRAKEFMFIVNCHRSVARRPKGYEIWWGCAHRENMMRPMLLPCFVNRDIRSGDIVRWLREPPQLLLFTSTHTNQRKNKIVKKLFLSSSQAGRWLSHARSPGDMLDVLHYCSIKNKPRWRAEFRLLSIWCWTAGCTYS